MKHPTKLLFVFVALFLPTILSAQSGSEIYAEANKISAEADKQLNAAYDQLIKSIRADNEKDRAELLVARLQESQRAWLKYRDAQVAFVGIHANIGSALTFRLLYWLLPRMTVARLQAISLITPPGAVALGWAMGGETFSLWSLLGGCLVLAGV